MRSAIPVGLPGGAFVAAARAKPNISSSLPSRSGHRYCSICWCAIRWYGWRLTTSSKRRCASASVDGSPLPLEEAAKLAVSPGGVAEARRRLAEMGIHPRAAALVRRTESAVGGAVPVGYRRRLR